ncbi:MAG: ABC transporter ATP-binding protein [Lachnospiraceae bacterium]|nr:ABC transporter ATP-binding protein [Lachnospiraceae bacterium]
MLQCQNVMKKYGKKTAVANITTNIVPGKIYALLGSNGSGKTTFMKMVAGLVKPTSGTITFNGMPIGEESKKYIAYMPTESFYYSYMTCKDAGKFYKDFYEDFDENKYYYLLNDMNLDPDMKVSKMSSGMTAKAKLALTLSRNSSIIMLDEPLNGIDIIAREKVIETVLKNASPNNAIIMSSHLVDELEKVIDYAIFVRQGEVVMQGDAEELRTRNGMSIVDMYKEIYKYD